MWGRASLARLIVARRDFVEHCSMEDVVMRTLDLSPLFRSTVGFDHLSRLLDSASRVEDQTFAYPPYNIEKLSDDSYRVTMAVAGFAETDLEIVVQSQTLTVTGRTAKEEAAHSFLHRGIAGRPFERRFQLADHIKVANAALVNGLLHIDLVREVPEALKPRTIAITTDVAQAPKVIERKAESKGEGKADRKAA
jgi:molecular chaperone IbpA